jgi:hypothetical protein
MLKGELTSYLQAISVLDDEAAMFSRGNVAEDAKISIDFSFNDKASRTLIKELAQLNHSYENQRVKQLDNESNRELEIRDTPVLTNIMQQLVTVIKGNEKITDIKLGTLPNLLRESSISLTAAHRAHQQEQETNQQIQQQQLSLSAKTRNSSQSLLQTASPVPQPTFLPLASPYISLLTDINNSLILIESIKSVVHIPIELQDWIYDHVIQKTKRDQANYAMQRLVEVSPPTLPHIT